MHARLARLWDAACSRPVSTTALVGLVASVQHARLAPQDVGFDPDQAAALLTAVRFREAITEGGLLDAIANSGRISPLVPLLTIPLMVLHPRSTTAALLLQPLLFVAAAAAVAALTAHLANRTAGLIAGIICLGCPTGIALARSYLLALGTALFLAVAVLALLHSERGHRSGAMALFGVAVGGMLLTRIVAVAFIPGIALACAHQMAMSRVAVRNALGSAAIAGGLAGPWWWANLPTIRDYVSSYGFGGESQDLGPSNPAVRLVLLAGGGVVMHFRLLLAISFILACIGIARHMASRRPSLRQLIGGHRDLTTVAIVVVAGFITLSTSANMGSNFTFPLLLLGVALTVALGAKCSGRVVEVAAVLALMASCANLALVGQWDVGRSRDFGGTDAAALLFFGVDLPAEADRWTAAQREVADGVASYAVDRPEVDVVVQQVVGGSQTFRSLSITLAEKLDRLPVEDGPASLDPGSVTRPRVLVVIRVDQVALGAGETPEDPTPTLRSARDVGWRIDERVHLPEGGDVLILTHPDTLPALTG